MLFFKQFNEVNVLLRKNRVQKLLDLNSGLKDHDLILTPKNVEEILVSRDRALKNQGRVELDTKVIREIIKRLSESSYITQNNFLSCINDVYETFHFIKNETSDFISDEDILAAVMVYFEKVCHGSVELLMGKGVEKIVENFKNQKGLAEIEKSEEEEEYWNFDK